MRKFDNDNLFTLGVIIFIIMAGIGLTLESKWHHEEAMARIAASRPVEVER